MRRRGIPKGSKSAADDPFANSDYFAASDVNIDDPWEGSWRSWWQEHSSASGNGPSAGGRLSTGGGPAVERRRYAEQPSTITRWQRKLRNWRVNWRRRLRTRNGRALIAMLIVTLVFACCAPGVFAARLTFAGVDGVRQLQNIETKLNTDGVGILLNPADLQSIRTQLATAHADFASLDTALNLASPITHLSGSLRADATLVRIGVELTAAGNDILGNGMALLTPLLSNPLGGATNQSRLDPALYPPARAAIQQAVQEIDAAASLSTTIAPGQLPPIGGAKAAKLLSQLPAIAHLVDQFALLFAAVPDLLGLNAATDYLVLALDRSELRTSGGFIGNYGILPVDGGRIGKLGLEDTYPLDATYFANTHQQAPAIFTWWPYRYGSPIYGWGLRDSGLSPDFPTDATMALDVLRNTGQTALYNSTTPIAGVIAITSVVMSQVIAIAGGTLTIPQYPQYPVTPQNLESTIHCFQLGSCQNVKPLNPPGTPVSTDRKRFTAYLGQALIDAIHHFSHQQLKDLGKQVVADIAAKDIQIYFVNPTAEQALVQMGAAANVPTTANDTFFVTDTNIGGNKANAYVTQQEEDIVTLLPDGGALHHLMIRTTYQRQGPLYEGTTGQTQYWEYRRVYLPTTARFLGITGYLGGPGRSVNLTTTSDLKDRSMVGATIAIGDGSAFGQCKAAGPQAPTWDCAAQVRDTFVAWYTPNAWHQVGQHIVYTLLAQRQAGSNVTLTVRVDATHAHDTAGAAQLIAQATGSGTSAHFGDTSANPNVNARTNAAWDALVAQATPVFNGPLTSDEELTWTP